MIRKRKLLYVDIKEVGKEKDTTIISPFFYKKTEKKITHRLK